MSHHPALPSVATLAPLRPAAVQIVVRDLARAQNFYQHVMGLELLDAGPTHAQLGVSGASLVQLETRPGVSAPDPRAAGLFHAAFLLPDRAALGAWLNHAIQTGVQMTGASDHIVSEAIYLTDPEGNGVEVYADRPAPHWRGADGAIEMSTGPLDIDSLLGAATDPWSGFPAEATLGHVHLQVGALAQSDHFWQDVMGFELTTQYPGASFYATGGYHHHIAANIWNSRGAGPRPRDTPGLAGVEVTAISEALLDDIQRRADGAESPARREGQSLFLQDPWGVEIQLKGDTANVD